MFDLEQRVGFAERHPLVVGETRGERDLGAEHGGDADLARRLGEAHHPVEPVVVGDGDRLEAEPGGFGGELFGMRRAVEEREVGVAVELGVGNGTRHARDGRLERLAAPAPRRSVATGVPRRATGGAPVAPGAARQHGFELGPCPRRVVETHLLSIERQYVERKFAERTQFATVSSARSLSEDTGLSPSIRSACRYEDKQTSRLTRGWTRGWNRIPSSHPECCWQSMTSSFDVPTRPAFAPPDSLSALRPTPTPSGCWRNRSRPT